MSSKALNKDIGQLRSNYAVLHNISIIDITDVTYIIDEKSGVYCRIKNKYRKKT